MSDCRLERMADFFAARSADYDRHMLEEVEGCRTAYAALAALLPVPTGRLLDLGCGTGLELEEIYRLQPAISVTGIDLSSVMLDKLREKYANHAPVLICDDYFRADFGRHPYDCALSCQTMHHFQHAQKLSLYRKIHAALAEGGLYLECDYMVETQDEEDFYFAELARIRQEQGLHDDEFYHYDTPCTVHNQLSLLAQAGFYACKVIFREGNTTILSAMKCAA